MGEGGDPVVGEGGDPVVGEGGDPVGAPAAAGTREQVSWSEKVGLMPLPPFTRTYMWIQAAPVQLVHTGGFGSRTVGEEGGGGGGGTTAKGYKTGRGAGGGGGDKERKGGEARGGGGCGREISLLRVCRVWRVPPRPTKG